MGRSAMTRPTFVSPMADRDLDAAADYISEASEANVGTRFYEAFYETLRSLSEMPEVGRIRFTSPHMPAPIRQWRRSRPTSTWSQRYRFSPVGK
ncbi:type II toxin-antitoxin system RelE/ParE family toxin [Capsulimonas corticalis]|uniref:type II toxin-antitoxin system RelE/ParE family toxin n=1 Tax=Capsulimonas corticalis TaxID=2219043 RepID=UPI000E658FCD